MAHLQTGTHNVPNETTLPRRRLFPSVRQGKRDGWTNLTVLRALQEPHTGGDEMVAWTRGMSVLAAGIAIVGRSIPCLADTKAEIQAQYDRLDAEFKKKDLKAFMSLFASDYTDKHLNG